MSARRVASLGVGLSLVLILTAVWVVSSGDETAAWLLCGEAAALASMLLLIRADLRPKPKHEVK